MRKLILMILGFFTLSLVACVDEPMDPDGGGDAQMDDGGADMDDAGEDMDMDLEM
ncbi:hypothetical protein [Candidatus Absconditicoccus praedator]|uniref:hypothetical protein n=1 Tax=Candidatus Absconditicoccus praedator TaxID=2735562 RepID=UPI001E51DBE3|nr:hypothetical protein [Candidatus Absconditicoccus praedator]UFX83516.1 hypothetical protein HLG78_05295 [Candidatus Absconditicoccus praedator]